MITFKMEERINLISMLLKLTILCKFLLKFSNSKLMRYLKLRQFGEDLFKLLKLLLFTEKSNVNEEENGESKNEERESSPKNEEQLSVVENN